MAFAALTLLGLGALAYSYHAHTEAVLCDWCNGEIEDRAKAVKRLGGPERAAGRLGLYLWLPERFTIYRAAVPRLLGFCGRPGIHALIRALGDSDGDVSGNAAEAFGLIGREAVPALVAALGDKRANVRSGAAYALSYIGPEAVEAVPALIKALDDRDSRVCSSAVSALGDIGPDAAAAVPRLIRLIKPNYEEDNEESEMSVEAMEALGQIGPRAGAAVPVLIKAMENSLGNRASAARALGGIGLAAAPAVPELIRSLKASRGRDTDDRIAIAIALGRIGPAAKAAVPTLEEKLLPKGCAGVDVEAFLEVRTELAVALWRITGEAGKAMPELVWSAGNEARPLIYRDGPPPNFFANFDNVEGPLAFSEDSNPLAVKSLLALKRSILAANGDGAKIKLLGALEESLGEGIDHALAVKRQQDRDRRNGTVSPPLSRDQVNFRLLGWCIEAPFYELRPASPGGKPEKVLRQSLTKADFEPPLDFDPAPLAVPTKDMPKSPPNQ